MRSLLRFLFTPIILWLLLTAHAFSLVQLCRHFLSEQHVFGLLLLLLQDLLLDHSLLLDFCRLQCVKRIALTGCSGLSRGSSRILTFRHIRVGGPMHKFRLSRLINLELGNVWVTLHMMSQIICERLVLAALLLLAVRMNAVVSMTTGAV